ncbi:hypothetical protein BDW22DRAFT_1479585 [Trametopsis cervina]|nr:hypothetical protein BDW22DRAFT_1479585 [Trametopsis cervina]
MNQVRQIMNAVSVLNEDYFDDNGNYPQWEDYASWDGGFLEEKIAYVRPRIFPDLPVGPQTPSTTGTQFPPEVLAHILFFVAMDDRGRQIKERVIAEGLEDSLIVAAIILAQPAYTLKSCSLVSVYWANQYRRYKFFNRNIKLQTYEDALAFRHYCMLSKSRLAPICDLIKEVHVHQVLPKSGSFLHLVYCPSTQHKLVGFYLQGPIESKEFTPTLSTPHYSLPYMTAIVPSVTPYRQIILATLHFSSFRDIAMHIKHFWNAEELRFESLTWTDIVATALLHTVRSQPTRRARKAFNIHAHNCTDNNILCLQAAILFPDSPLRIIPDRDQDFAMNIARSFHTHLTSLTNNARNVSSSAHYDIPRVDQLRFCVNSALLGYPGLNIQFICQRGGQTEASRDYTEGPFRITAIMVSILRALGPESPEDAFCTADLALLRSRLANLPAIQSIVFAFHGYSIMRGVLDRYPALRKPLANRQKYMLVCRRMFDEQLDSAAVVHPWGLETHSAPRSDWVAVEPSTLELTGLDKTWEHENDILPDFVNHSHR